MHARFRVSRCSMPRWRSRPAFFSEHMPGVSRTWWLIAALALAIGSLLLARRRAVAAAGLSLVTWAMAGALSVQLRTEPGIPNIDYLMAGEEVVVTAHVVRDGILRPTAFGGIKQSLDAITEQVTSPTESASISFGVRLNL